MTLIQKMTISLVCGLFLACAGTSVYFMAFYCSPEATHDRNTRIAKQYVKTHACVLAERIPAAKSYDYNSGTEVIRPDRLSFKCEGLNAPVNIDLMRPW